MPERIGREEGRHLFGSNPQRYDDSRPDYPEWIYERLRDGGALVPGSSTLEIGAGSGRATRRLLEYGADPLTIVEPDERFAAMLASVVDGFKADCRVIHTSFEDVELRPGHFDLVAAATAFHWIAPIAGLRKARRLLKAEGRAALFWNVLQDLDKQDAFHDATEDLLSPLAESPSGAPNDVPYALDRAAREADAKTAGFGGVDYFESKWTVVLEPEQIGALYGGFSHIQRLDEESRTKILSQLMELAATRFGGRVERNVTSCLYVLS